MFKDKLKDLLESCPSKQENEMGFPKDWHKEPLWE